MPVDLASGAVWPLVLNWASVATAVGTVGAVIAAVWIAVSSGRQTRKIVQRQFIHSDEQRRLQQEHSDRQLREQWAYSDDHLRDQQKHNDEQLKKQRQHSDKQLKEEQDAANERLQEQFRRADDLERSSEAAAVQVIGYRLVFDESKAADPQNPSAIPEVLVINRGKYAITDLAVRLSPDGQSVVELRKSQNMTDIGTVPSYWSKEVIGNLGEVYGGTIPPGAGMRFEGDEMLDSVLRESFPIVRWRDRWGRTWEYRKGETYTTLLGWPWI